MKHSKETIVISVFGQEYTIEKGETVVIEGDYLTIQGVPFTRKDSVFSRHFFSF